MSQTRLSGLGKPDKNVLYIYLVVDDEIFFLLHEEGIKLLNLGVQQTNKDRFCRSRRRDQILEFFVTEKLVTPLRQRLLYLFFNPLTELHQNKCICLNEEGKEIYYNEIWRKKKTLQRDINSGYEIEYEKGYAQLWRDEVL